MKLFDKIKNVFKGNKEETVLNYDKGLKKTREEFISELSNLSKKYKFINEDYFEELENILIMADIGVSTVMNFVDLLKKRVKKENIEDTNVLKEIIVDELFIMYVGNDIIDSKIHFNSDGPTIILFVGVNGVGKTTTIGKIANKYKNLNKKVLLMATPVTVKGEKIKDLIQKLEANDIVELIAMPKLVEFAERGEFNTEKVKEYIPKLQEIAKTISEIDVLQSFATVTEENNYVREITREKDITSKKFKN